MRDDWKRALKAAGRKAQAARLDVMIFSEFVLCTTPASPLGKSDRSTIEVWHLRGHPRERAMLVDNRFHAE